MLKSEVAKLVFVVMNTYPAIYKNYGEAETEIMVTNWAGLLNDTPYQLASAGLTNYIKNDKAGFPPSPGQLLDEAKKISEKYKLANLLIALGQSDEDVFYNTGLHINQVKRDGIEVHN